MYQVWTVYEESGTKFYVVNTETKKVQSAWMRLFDAKLTCDKLNLLSRGKIKKA